MQKMQKGRQKALTHSQGRFSSRRRPRSPHGVYYLCVLVGIALTVPSCFAGLRRVALRHVWQDSHAADVVGAISFEQARPPRAGLAALKAGEEGSNMELFQQSLIEGWGKTLGDLAIREEDWAQELQLGGNRTQQVLQAGDLLLGNPDAFIRDGLDYSTSDYRRVMES
eukprot:TRINITY_DN24554_c0_g1_i3.p1 TRINITY_DN24554_c0_g1~~TRINITY_DN24554_c0_g1_i3.p1  ORF type:complete len:168 (-),score=27.21 TRINITY_DN24554_c0_g1_i3:174-677(-)